MSWGNLNSPLPCKLNTAGGGTADGVTDNAYLSLAAALKAFTIFSFPIQSHILISGDLLPGEKADHQLHS